MENNPIEKANCTLTQGRIIRAGLIEESEGHEPARRLVLRSQEHGINAGFIQIRCERSQSNMARAKIVLEELNDL